MALVTCPECAKPVSESAEACPGCGFKLTGEIVAAQRQKQKAAEAAAGTTGLALLGLCLLCCAGVCSGGLLNKDSSSSSSTSSPSYYTTPASYTSSEDEQLMNLPSLRGYSDSEKQQIIDAAKDLDRKVRDLERRRGY